MGYQILDNDYENHPWFQDKEKVRENHRYGIKEIPNIKLTFSYGFKAFDNYKEYTLYIDTARGYFEEYDTKKGWKCVIAFTLFSPKEYEKITENKWQHVRIQTEDIWRSEKTGKDEFYISPSRVFNTYNIKHKLQACGEASTWYLTLWNEEPKIYEPKDIPLEKVQL